MEDAEAGLTAQRTRPEIRSTYNISAVTVERKGSHLVVPGGVDVVAAAEDDGDIGGVAAALARPESARNATIE